MSARTRRRPGPRTRSAVQHFPDSEQHSDVAEVAMRLDAIESTAAQALVGLVDKDQALLAIVGDASWARLSCLALRAHSAARVEVESRVDLTEAVASQALLGMGDKGQALVAIAALAQNASRHLKAVLT